MFSTRVGFYGGTAKQWYEYSNAEVLSTVSAWTRSGNISNTTFNLGSVINSEGVYARLVAHPNGNLYAAPGQTTKNTILEINPANNSFREINVGRTFTGTFKYLGGAVGSDNKIYWPPYDSSNVLIYDPVANVATTQTWGLTFTGSAKYYNFVAGPGNNKIYAFGGFQTCLIINVSANTAVQSTLGGVHPATASIRWAGGVLGFDNKIYGAPYSSATVLVINTANDTATTQTWGLTIGSQASQGIYNGKNGNVYITAHNQSRIHTINVSANTASTISSSGSKTLGGSIMSDGNILAVPHPDPGTAGFMTINVTNNTINTNQAGIPSTTKRYSATLANNGNVYVMAWNTSNTHVIVVNSSGTGQNLSNYSDVYLTPYLNSK